MNFRNVHGHKFHFYYELSFYGPPLKEIFVLEPVYYQYSLLIEQPVGVRFVVYCCLNVNIRI